jgi:hypothetical protein
MDMLTEPVDLHTTIAPASPTWDPAFLQHLEDATANLRKARDLVGNANRHGMYDNADAVRYARDAVTQLRSLMNRYEDLPPGLLETLDGAVRESRAAIASVYGSPGGKQLVHEAAVRLELAATSLERLVNGG